ncbi:MAG: hypothetical protein ABSE86_21285 [Bryobacteraceae bacterium]|jgi:uncharacterized protein (TIGR03437 family)
MYNRTFLGSILLFFSLNFAGWSQPYTITTVAGTDRLLDGHSANTVPLRSPVAVAVDSNGNLYIADASDNRIRKVDPSGIISTYAGTGVPGYNGDRIKAAAAQLNFPSALAFDAAGNLYVADLGNSRVRVISSDGTINTVAGNGAPGILGDNGPAIQAQVDPLSVAVDTQGNLFISTTEFYIRKVDTNGIITTIAGQGRPGYGGDNGPANLAIIGQVPAMVCDAKGDLYLADLFNGYVRMIDTAGIIHPVAGSGQFGYIDDFIPALQAVMSPQGLALDSSGNNLYISDLTLNAVRVVDLTTMLIHSVAGNGNAGFLGDGGTPLLAELEGPAGLALDSSNDIYVADYANRRVRKIAGNVISTIAGTSDGDGGPATSAFLNFPQGLAVDSANNLVVADTGNSIARRFSFGGSINTFGQLMGAPVAVAVDTSGNFYVTDDEPLVLEISKTGATSIIAGDAQSGYSGDGGPATSAMIANPTGVAVDAAGNVYFTDDTNSRIRKVTISSGVVTTIAGNGKPNYSGDNGPALNAGLDPFDVAVDSQGNLYVADSLNSRVRKIALDGTITTVAGTGIAGYAGDGGPAVAAGIAFPTGVAVDGAGNLYIADHGNAVVRRVTATGLITTIAGTPGLSMPSAGDGGPAAGAQLDPWKVTVDPAGDVYVTDSTNDRVRRLTLLVITPASMSIVAGDKQSGTVGTALGDPLVIKVAAAGGAGIPGVTVNFTVSPSGAATVNPSPAITLNDGTVTANVLLGITAGSLTITASDGISDVSFSLTANPAVSPTAPVISTAGIVSGGLSAPPLTTVAPNAIATIFGDKFAPPGTARQVGQQDLVNGKIPTSLAGACAVFGTQLAPILGVYPGQLNIQVPQLPPGPTPVQVITQCGTPQAQTSNAETVTIQATAPEFFYYVHTASGQNPIAAINAVTHAAVGAPGLVSGGDFAPAQRGDLLTLFGTGFGATAPSYGPGELPTGAAQVTAPVSITFGGVQLAASDILYVGVTENAGLYQVNLRVPNQVPDGDQSLVITIGGVASPSGGFVTVKGGPSSAASLP